MLPGKADLLRSSASSASHNHPVLGTNRTGCAALARPMGDWHTCPGILLPASDGSDVIVESNSSQKWPRGAAMPWLPDDRQDPPKALPPVIPHNPSLGRSCCHAWPPQGSPANAKQKVQLPLERQHYFRGV